jgi:hypothetical protein
MEDGMADENSVGKVMPKEGGTSHRGPMVGGGPDREKNAADQPVIDDNASDEETQGSPPSPAETA